MALTITQQNFDELKSSGKPMLVDFWASWCGPCRMIAPYIDQLAEEYEGRAIVGKIDVDMEQMLAMTLGIRNVPTLFFFKNGEIVDKQIGAAPKSVIEAKLKAIIDNPE